LHKLPSHRRGKTAIKTLFFDSFHGKSVLLTKIAISIFAIVLGIVFLIVCVYVIIPAIIASTADKIDQNFSAEMYEKTIENPDITRNNVHQAFEQPE
jgi:predicted RNA methylase